MKIGFLILMVWLVLMTSATTDGVDAKLSRKVSAGLNNDQKLTNNNNVAAGNFKEINDADGYYPRDSSPGSHHRYNTINPPKDGKK
ncbi:hypothetical protein ACET3Z_024437 [Daucus carota]